jgi:hypothetical protein
MRRKLIGAAVVWSAWAVLTVAAVFYIRHYSRNIPYMDDFTLVPIMTGNEPVNLEWLWSQHNEHRPVVSRLILTGLLRYISSDFRLGLYANAGLLSAAAASMLILARRVRGYSSATDIVLPASILSVGQAETLLIGYALNLMLTSWLTCELIVLGLTAERSDYEWRRTLRLGLIAILLPLCGGSGLVMLPAVLLWLLFRATMRWHDAQRFATWNRLIGLGFGLVGVAVAVLYMAGYTPPANHKPAPSIVAAMKTTLEYFSLVVWPNAQVWALRVGAGVVFFAAITLIWLGVIGVRNRGERTQAVAMAAIIAAMLCAGVAVGFSRSFMGPGAGLASRYVTTSAPLIIALYFAWFLHGPKRAQRIIHGLMFLAVVVAIPANARVARSIGEDRRVTYSRFERCLKSHPPLAVLVKTAFPRLHPEEPVIVESFRMLKDARMCGFGAIADDRVTEAHAHSKTVR